VLRSLARACTLTAAWSIALGVSSCSLVLDWNGYTGGGSPGRNVDASDDEGGDGASDADDRADGRALDAPEDVLVVDAPQVVEAAPPCGPSSCGGCCNANGFCAGGESTTTCGTGGEACQDCGNSGQSCSQGTCSSVPPPMDAGTQPVCDVDECNSMFRCAPVYQSACCKTDGTCGCQIMIPPGPCM